MTAGATDISTFARLAVSEEVRRDVARFVADLRAARGEGPVSVTAFGSAVSGGYVEGTSDLNLLVVFDALRIADIGEAARLAQRWLRRRKFAPRFLSRRNIQSAARAFPIDFLEMRDAHLVLHGEDVLHGLEFARDALRWQLAHEITGMRIRVKQQFWRAAGDERTLRLILRRRYSSLVRLLRVTLLLDGKEPPLDHAAVQEAAIAAYGLDRDAVGHLAALRAGTLRLSGAALVAAFDQLLELIRVADARVAQLQG